MRQSLRLVGAVLVVAAAALALPLLDLGGSPGTATLELGPAQTGSLRAAPTATEAPAPALVPQSREEIRFSFAPVVKRVAPAVVNVYATSRVEVRSPFEGDPFFERFFGLGDPFGMPERRRERARSSLGSGVIVDAQGLVVTNNHVISGASEVKVALADGREYQAAILLRDEGSDLAVLKIENGEDGFPVLDFADSDELEVGDLVLAVGNPFGVGQTVTSGIVSAVARTNRGISDSGFFVQTDAAINPGNSGGALVDLEGRVVGINTAIFSRSGGSIGIGFAIPSNMVRSVVAQALAGSTSVARPWIGLDCQEVTSDIAASLGLAVPQGALVRQVDPNSPGAKAGLQAGDLILRAAGRDIGSPAALDYRLAVAGIGSTVELQVWRDGVTLALSVVPEAEPQLDESDLMLLGGESPLTGAIVADFSSTLAGRLNIRAESGAIIVDVEPRSPAARFGFRPGDVVVKAQGDAVESAGQLAEVVEAGSRLWRITVNRGGRISNLVIGG
jgi:Do/DeqQ family serine protease